MKEGPGLSLSRRYYETAVAPVLSRHFADLPHAAARIGRGSEVLGYDTKMSADHDFGPCVQIFLPEAEFSKAATDVMCVLEASLPERFDGWVVRYRSNTRPPSSDKQLAGMLGSDHGVELYTLSAWCERFLQRQFPDAPSVQDWLCCSEQLFLMVTAGAVFRDDVGELSGLRHRLDYFPDDIWLYKLSAQWRLIAIDRPYVGRSGDAGDDIGSRVIAARMVDNIMRLALLIERRYAPYPKWLGTAFSRLECANSLTPCVAKVLSANDWRDREQGLIESCSLLAHLQIDRSIPGATAPVLQTLHGRPFRFVDSIAISDGLREAIADPYVRQLPQFGAADQILTANAALSVPRLAKAAWLGVLNEKLWWQ